MSDNKNPVPPVQGWAWTLLSLATVLGILAVWTESEKLGGTAGIVALLGFIVGSIAINSGGRK